MPPELTEMLVMTATLAFLSGIFLGGLWVYGWNRPPKPLTRAQMLERGLTPCPECDATGKVPCLVCNALGAYRDVTADYLSERDRDWKARGLQ